MIAPGALRRLPKVELHRHLDGSVRVETLADLARSHGLDLGASSLEELRRRATVTEPMRDLQSVLDAFSTLQRALCSYEAVERVAFENVEDCWNDGVVLAELRFAPAFIAAGKHLDHAGIVEAVVAGVRRGMEKWPVRVGLIGILARGQPLEENRRALRALLHARTVGGAATGLLVGLDLADREDGVDPRPLVPLVDEARGAGLGITVHSGENTSAETMRRTLACFRPDRIGHGIRAWGDAELVGRLRDEGVLLEVCPTSNRLTSSVPSIAAHPLPRLLRAGVPVSLNSDDPCLFAIDLVHEYELCGREWGFGPAEFQAMNLAALERSFLPPEAKEEVRRALG